MLVSPYYEPLSEREVEAHVRAVARTGLPLMLYNNPGGVGWSMSVELVARLAAIEGVEYLKDTTGDARRIFDIAELVGDRLELLNGQDTLTLLGFLAGTQAAVWGAPNATPAPCVRLWELVVREGDLDDARRLWRDFYPLNRFFEAEGYVPPVRAGAELRGLRVGPPRRPMLPLPEPKRARLRALMERVDRVMGAPVALSTSAPLRSSSMGTGNRVASSS
jgi:dihydrodipicolinate synthase/N-acetylneuraminate lyase